MNKNLKMVRGDTLSFGIEYSFDDESVQDLDTCYFSCKQNADDEEYIFQKSLNFYSYYLPPFKSILNNYLFLFLL